METGMQTLRKLIKQSLKVTILLSLLLLTSCGWSRSIVIPSDRTVTCPEDTTKPCQVSKAWLLERYETERGLLKQLEAHEMGKKTKLFTETGKYRITDKAGNEDPQYFIKLAKAEKRKKKANAKGIRTK